MSRETGRVKWFSSEKGYGFIERDGQEDVFVHYSQIAMEGFRTLDAGEPVEFDIIAGERGPKAQSVMRLSADANGNGNGASGGVSDGAERHAEDESGVASGIVDTLREKLAMLTNRA